MSSGMAIGIGAAVGLAVGILVSLVTEIPLAPEGGLLIGVLVGWFGLRSSERP
ncbi:MAG: hypothetical protein AB7T48_11315 [Solirubrobacterales bacterium]